MHQITISGEKFTVPARYAEGHTINANEATALNQVMAENLRNNFAAKVKSAKEAGSFDAQTMQLSFDEYAAKYEFGVRSVRSGGGGGTSKDPIQKLAVELAMEAVKVALRSRGHKIGGKDSDYTTAQIREAAEKIVSDPQKGARFVESAREQYEATQSAANDALDDILGDMTQAEAA